MTRGNPTSLRAGITLTEVLVALFVAALGLISLMTLFPLGALQLGQALKDDRCVQTAVQTDGFLRAYWQQHVVEPTQPNPPAGSKQPDPFKWAMDDPNLLYQVPVPPGPGSTSYSQTGSGPYFYNAYPSGLSQYAFTSGAPLPPTAGTSPVTPYSLPSDVYNGPSPPDPTSMSSGNMPSTPTTSFFESSVSVTNLYVTPATASAMVSSYPVMIDPLGSLARSLTEARYWVGYDAARFPPATSPPLLARRNLLSVTTQPATAPTPTLNAIQTCYLNDDIAFAGNGTPDTSASSGQLTRQGRYNWAAIIQRPVNYDQANRLRATLKILVFDGRPALFASADSEVAVQTTDATNNPLTVQPASANGATPGDRSLSFLLPAPTDPTAPPIVRKGGWVMDGTTSTHTAANTAASATTYLRNAEFYRIVGVTPDPTTPNRYTVDIDPPIRPRADGQTTPYQATLYFFAGLAEVFARPALGDLRTDYTTNNILNLP